MWAKQCSRQNYNTGIVIRQLCLPGRIFCSNPILIVVGISRLNWTYKPNMHNAAKRPWNVS
jgi:hypothetical protein